MRRGEGRRKGTRTVTSRRAHLGSDKDLFEGHYVGMHQLPMVHDFALYILVIKTLPKPYELDCYIFACRRGGG